MKSNITIAILVLGALSSNCLSQVIYQYTHGANGSRVFELADDTNVFPQDGFRAYDNWRTPSQGGISRLKGTLIAGTTEFADDLYLETHGPALLSDIGFSVANLSLTSQLTSYRITIRFYDAQRVLLGTDSFNNGGPINPNTGVAFFSGGGFYQGLGIVLPTQMFMSTQITEIEGVESSDIGFRLQGPRTTGYSTQFAQNFTNGQTIDFDGTDQTNLRYFIDTADVPAPASAASLLAALYCAFRRRR